MAHHQTHLLLVLVVAVALAQSALGAPAAKTKQQQQQRKLVRQHAPSNPPVVGGLPGSGASAAKVNIVFPDQSSHNLTLPCNQWTTLSDSQKVYVSRNSLQISDDDNGDLSYNATASNLLTGEYIFEGSFQNLDVNITWDTQNTGVPLTLYSKATFSACHFTDPLPQLYNERFCFAERNDDWALWSYNVDHRWLVMGEVNSDTYAYGDYAVQLPSYKLVNHIVSVRLDAFDDKQYQVTFYDVCS